MALQHLHLIEDDERLAKMVAEYLGQSGFTVSHSASGTDGLLRLESASSTPIDLVILDIMLPDMDGLEVCRRIRALHAPIASIPVVMLTAKGDAMDRIIGLEIGADDYMAKPFEPRELLARIRAVLRRKADPATAGTVSAPNSHAITMGSPTGSESQLLQFGSLEIDRDARVVRVQGKRCDLTAYQFDLLVALAENAGKVMSRDKIMEIVRGRELEAFDRSIDVHMGRIRAAIEIDVKNPQRILTVRGVGYVFARHQD
ncbi:response regulator transcription factor [Curvibacter sp. CHRR-16]|uniref:response regulator n=1 Tax=Curvibacter sp. CHRR-16 TaxID=2835872 RepID=UPI001BDA3CCC|nr:response regulator transcription factor [Curvibacter sp. CHRR-16]MBT0570077.1 response regulator transcription factor [Curvibacter sp. CHRR-16]